MIDIPPALRKVRSVAGESAWLDALPDLVGEIASRWSLEIGRSLEGFGVNARVAAATTGWARPVSAAGEGALPAASGDLRR